MERGSNHLWDPAGFLDLQSLSAINLFSGNFCSLNVPKGGGAGFQYLPLTLMKLSLSTCLRRRALGLSGVYIEKLS